MNLDAAQFLAEPDFTPTRRWARLVDGLNPYGSMSLISQREGGLSAGSTCAPRGREAGRASSTRSPGVRAGVHDHAVNLDLGSPEQIKGRSRLVASSRLVACCSVPRLPLDTPTTDAYCLLYTPSVVLDHADSFTVSQLRGNDCVCRRKHPLW